MDKPKDIIFEKSVSALLKGVKMARLSKLVLGMDGQISAALSKKLIGGTWMQGKVFLTPERLVFHPSRLNGPFVKNIEDLRFELPLSEIAEVRERLGMVGPMLDLVTSEETWTLRCLGTDKLKAEIDAARAP